MILLTELTIISIFICSTMSYNTIQSRHDDDDDDDNKDDDPIPNVTYHKSQPVS